MSRSRLSVVEISWEIASSRISDSDFWHLHLDVTWGLSLIITVYVTNFWIPDRILDDSFSLFPISLGMAISMTDISRMLHVQTSQTALHV